MSVHYRSSGLSIEEVTGRCGGIILVSVVYVSSACLFVITEQVKYVLQITVLAKEYGF